LSFDFSKRVAKLRRRQRARRLRVWLIIFATIVAALTLTAYAVSARSPRAVTVDGKIVGVVQDRRLVSQAVDTLLAEARQKYGNDVVLAGRLRYGRIAAPAPSRGGSRPAATPAGGAAASGGATAPPGGVTASSSPPQSSATMAATSPAAPAVGAPPLLTSENITTVLSAHLPIVVRGAVIVCDGREAVALKGASDAREAVASLRTDYEQSLAAAAGTTVLSVVFREKVEVLEKLVRVIDIRTIEQAKAILLRGTDEVREHVVQPDESLWTISQANRTNVESLWQANPQLRGSEMIFPGQKLSLIVARPFTHLRSVESVTYNEGIPFSTQVIEDSNRWPWEQIVTQPGVYGVREVTKEIERENGQVVAQKVLNTSILGQPVTQVLIQGTKIIPQRGTGSYIWPALGTVTSGFGWRPREFHTGIDVAAPLGEPVRAADAGTVVQVNSTRWGYGKLVLIDHGAGRVRTLYGHLSAFLVQVGQVVEAGQVIGYVGNTGRSTGPHLHFEIMVDGKHQDPIGFYPR
jgi:murein DD-endopeptidase MepM/ murein hydrolase activator NlpD